MALTAFCRSIPFGPTRAASMCRAVGPTFGPTFQSEVLLLCLQRLGRARSFDHVLCICIQQSAITNLNKAVRGFLSGLSGRPLPSWPLGKQRAVAFRFERFEVESWRNARSGRAKDWRGDEAACDRVCPLQSVNSSHAACCHSLTLSAKVGCTCSTGVPKEVACFATSPTLQARLGQLCQLFQPLGLVKPW